MKKTWTYSGNPLGSPRHSMFHVGVGGVFMPLPTPRIAADSYGYSVWKPSCSTVTQCASSHIRSPSI